MGREGQTQRQVKGAWSGLCDSRWEREHTLGKKVSLGFPALEAAANCTQKPGRASLAASAGKLGAWGMGAATARLVWGGLR